MSHSTFESLVVKPVDAGLASALQHAIDQKTKPLGALGKLEQLALRIGLVQRTLHPRLERPVVMVFAADHGIVHAGVSPYPQEVTAQMVYNFLNGGAAVNVLARQHNMQVRVIDAGVNHHFAPHPALVNAKIGMGTANMLHQPAMTATQCEQAMRQGAALADAELKAGSNILAFGEMGIGNTTAAAAIFSAISGLPPAQCAGRGTGLDEEGLNRKIAVIEQVLQRHAGALQSPFDILAHVGGFEIVMMAGAMLQAASQGALLLIDGFITTAALLVAQRMQPAILDYCIFAHCSDENGHARMLKLLQAEPLLALNMRLGEGTGAVLAYPLVQAAVNFLNDMASFESAGVSGKSD